MFCVAACAQAKISVMSSVAFLVCNKGFDPALLFFRDPYEADRIEVRPIGPYLFAFSVFQSVCGEGAAFEWARSELRLARDGLLYTRAQFQLYDPVEYLSIWLDSEPRTRLLEQAFELQIWYERGYHREGHRRGSDTVSLLANSPDIIMYPIEIICYLYEGHRGWIPYHLYPDVATEVGDLRHALRRRFLYWDGWGDVSVYRYVASQFVYQAMDDDCALISDILCLEDITRDNVFYVLKVPGEIIDLEVT
jgi:hypothetical protein